MKKVFLVLICIFCLVSIYFKEIHANKIETFDDLTTINFQEKLPYVRLENIKRICSYDYCDYLIGSNFASAFESYIERYLKSTNNKETASAIKINGVKITEIVLEN